MNRSYFVLLIPLVCLLLGRFLHLLFPGNTLTATARIKLRLFCYNYLPLLMFAMATVYLIISRDGKFSIILSFGFFVGSLLRLVFSGRQYLVTFLAHPHGISLSYFTPFLVHRSREFGQAEISIIEVTQRNWMADYPAALNISYQKDLLEYQVIDAKLKAAVQAQLQDIESGKLNQDEKVSG